MAKNKTKETQNSVADYLTNISDEKKRNDYSAIIELISKHTGIEPKIWGTSIVGFGIYHYKYNSGHEGEAPLAGIASRANAITLYLGSNFDNRDELLFKFGKHKTGKGCIYIQKLEDIDKEILVNPKNLSIFLTIKKYLTFGYISLAQNWLFLNRGFPNDNPLTIAHSYNSLRFVCIIRVKMVKNSIDYHKKQYAFNI